MKVISRQHLNKEIQVTLKRYNINKDYQEIEFIIDRYFHYSVLALLHGIACYVTRFFIFSLGYININSVPRNKRKSTFFSSRAFGYSFFIVAKSEKMEKNGYTFKTDKTLLQKIATHNEGDIIYKLLKT